jgi:hypothetical protein
MLLLCLCSVLKFNPHCMHQGLHMSLNIVVQRVGSCDLDGEADGPFRPVQGFWKCWLRNAVTCLPNWGGAPYSCGPSCCLIWRGLSSNNTSSSSSRQWRQCSSCTNGPVDHLTCSNTAPNVNRKLVPKICFCGCVRIIKWPDVWIQCLLNVTSTVNNISLWSSGSQRASGETPDV